MSHHGRHTSSLLLRATTVMAIRVISSGVVATKGHNNDLLICPTPLAESGTSLQNYLLTSSALMRWLTWIDKTNFWCFYGRHHLLFMQLNKRETCLLISTTSLSELGRRHIKKFYTNIFFIQHRGKSSPHQSGYHGLAGWFHITIEPNANHEYSCV
jgi:hypothetical protein